MCRRSVVFRHVYGRDVPRISVKITCRKVFKTQTSDMGAHVDRSQRSREDDKKRSGEKRSGNVGMKEVQCADNRWTLPTHDHLGKVFVLCDTCILP